ncbi:MAG: cytochrome c3 family protein [Chloroflexota bacterium]
MKARRLTFLTTTSIFAAVIAALLIVASALTMGGSMYSPGALNAIPGNVLGGVASHADIAGNCKACHVAPWEADTMDDRCSTCHVDVAAEMKDPASVHGRMMQIDPKAQCRTCHPEHKGSDALLTVLEGWQFPHDVARFKLKSHQLTAKKEPFLCADCHGNDVTKFDQLTCRECHITMDMAFMVEHQVAFGENCLECHDGVDRFGKDFDHNKFAFMLNGKHAAVKCAQCHVQTTTISDLRLTSQVCFACHAKDDPHQGSLGTDCVACHSPEGWKPSSFDHNLSDFKLTGAHGQVVCEKCHVNGVFKGTPKDCFSCHNQIDPHMGQFGTACEKCHTTDAWKPAQFDHNLTGFRLIGSHKNVDCKACHVNGVYKNTPQDCFACHAARDAHQGQFGKNCGACHQPTKWSDATFDHSKTAFPLIGKHMNQACAACHTNGIFKGTPKDCFACHAKNDKHNGELGTNCSTCHMPTGWKNVTFDHNSSAFPLTGKHATVVCSQCHQSGRYKIPTDCAACHSEPVFHAGAFGTNCAQCHTTADWASAPFPGTHFTALGQNFLDHHGATCKTCHTTTVHDFTCLACHKTNPLPPKNATPAPTSLPVSTGTAVIDAASVTNSINPSSITVGDTSQVTVSVNNIPAQGYTSTEFTCTYDPALVDVSNISVGNLFGADAVTGIFGPQNGSFILGVAGSHGNKASGSGAAFTFNAKGLQAGQTSVDCKARVSEGQNVLKSIPSTPSNMTIAGIVPTPTTMPASASITGQVLASKLVTIRLYNPDNSIATTATANPDGSFNITVPGGTYTIAASADGFLGAQGSVTALNGSSVSKAAVSLIAGDIDNNGVVDEFDALTIRMNYGNTIPAAADLNNDGVINVLDLGILAENYGKSGVLLWP